MGEYLWLTIVSPEQPDGVELLFEPSDHPAVSACKKAFFADDTYGNLIYIASMRETT